MARIFLPGSRQHQLQLLAGLMGGLTHVKADAEFPPLAVGANDAAWRRLNDFKPGGAVGPGTGLMQQIPSNWQSRKARAEAEVESAMGGAPTPLEVHERERIRGRVEFAWTRGEQIDRYDLVRYTRMVLPTLWCPREQPTVHLFGKQGSLQFCIVTGHGPDRRIAVDVLCPHCGDIRSVRFSPYAS